MRMISFLGIVLFACLIFLLFNNLFFGFSGKSIAGLILLESLDVVEKGILGENKDTSPQTDIALGKQCIDSDGGKEFFIFSSIRGYDKHGDFYVVNDSCNEKNLTEYFCKESSIMYVIYLCPNGCSGGACLLENNTGSTNETNKSIESLFCTDTDGGLNYFFKGSCSDSLGSLEDSCAIGGLNGWFLKEAYCEKSLCIFLDYNCLEGCLEGKCLESGTINEEGVFFSAQDFGSQTGLACTDSDNGDLYKKGVVRDSFDTGERSFEDRCILLVGEQEPLEVKNCQGKECFFKEGSCKENGKYLVETYPCSKGCIDGACFRNPTFFEKLLRFFKGLFGNS